ncbi:MAG TPA: FtsX-like permease family protein [Capillimicrobium sp.]|nr:FtsX-like permease family protein [Capillimicrobium sp.]
MSPQRPAGARLRSFAGLSARSLRARPLRSVLTAGAVVLGVGMVFGVLLLVGTIHSTFGRLYDSIYGRTDIVLSGRQAVGALRASAIERVRAVPGVETASGSVFSIFRTVDEDGEVRRGLLDQLYVVGVDYDQPDTSGAARVEGRDPVAGRREIELPADWAAEQGLAVGDQVVVSTPTGLAELRVAGLYAFEGGLDLAGYGTGAMPVADARALMDKPDVWDEIAVIVRDGASVDRVRAALRQELGPGVDVATPQAKSDEIQEQLAGLDMVLYFFSGIALFVGAFLILNSFSMTVLQRMRELGTLRALGAGNGRIARGILAEAAILGVVGSVLGLALGLGLARLLVRAVQGWGMPVGAIELSAVAAIAAVATGLLATLAGALWPALRASRISPIAALRGGGTARTAPGARRAIVGLALFLPGLAVGGLLWFGNTSGSGLSALAGIVTTMVMLLGLVRLAPFVVLPLVRLLARPLCAVMPAEGRLASDAARANPTRTAATAATLIVALSVVVVNMTIASSVIGSVEDDFDRRFARDLTVQPIGYQDFGPPAAGITRALRERIAAMPEAGAVARRRALYASEMPGSGVDGMLIAFDPAEYAQLDRTEYEGATRAQAHAGLAAGGIVVSRSFADVEGLRTGDRLRLEGPAGVRDAPIVAVADAIESVGNMALMSLDTMRDVYGVQTDTQLLVQAASPAQREALAARVDRLLARDYPGVESLSNAAAKARVTAAIDEQFAFFNAIVAIAVIVGMLGIVNTLSMSVIERTREIGVLRALGASRWRVRRTMADETLLISIAGTLAGILAGVVIAVVWVLSMRATAFTSLSLHLPLGTLAIIALLGVVIGIVAAILPARRAARLDPLTALHYE